MNCLVISFPERTQNYTIVFTIFNHIICSTSYLVYLTVYDKKRSVPSSKSYDPYPHLHGGHTLGTHRLCPFMSVTCIKCQIGMCAPHKIILNLMLWKKRTILYRYLMGNLPRLHRSKKNYRKIIVIGQIIDSGQINSFMCFKSIIKSIHYSNFWNESIFYLVSPIQNNNFMIINQFFFIFYN